MPTFDGKFKSFMIWWIRFRAFATVYKFIEALAPVDEANLPNTEGDVLDEAIPADMLKIAARKRNAVAMANFAMSFTDETTLGMIFKAISTDWPTGKSSVVVALLLKKFKPEDTMTRVELRQELNKITMKKGDEPAALFEQISSVENRYNTGATRVDKADLIAVILDAASADYQAVLTSEQRSKGDQLTSDDLEDALT